jgi:hypothetical protein
MKIKTSGFVEGQNFSQRNPESSAEVIKAVISLTELRVQCLP